MSGLTKEEEEFILNGGFNITNNSFVTNNNNTDTINDSHFFLNQEEKFKKEILSLKNENEKLKMNNRALISKCEFNEEKIIDINDLKKEIKFLKHENSQNDENKIKTVLRNVREIILGLEPEDIYYKLKDFPEDELKINELVLIKVIELVKPFKKENKAIRLENSSLKEEIKFKNEKLKGQLQEIESLEILLRNKEDIFKKISKRKEDGNRNVNIELDNAYKNIKELQEKLINEENVNKENRKLKEDLEILNHKLKIYKNYQLDDHKKNDINENFEMRSNIEIVKKEKEFIYKENIKLLEETRSLKDRLQVSEEEKKTLKQNHDDLLKELLNNQKNLSQNYENRIKENLNNYNNIQKNEIDNLKRGLSELYEKQLSFLNEQKNDLKFDNVELKNNLKEKELIINDLFKENKLLSNKVDGEICEIRVNYRLKSGELERKTIELENLKVWEIKIKNENNMLREKLNILKTEIFKVKGQSNEELSQIRAENIMFKRELDSYNKIENEIDKGILETCKFSEKSPDFLKTLSSIPTSKNKRILQAIKLGNKLTEKEKELNDLIKENEILKNKLENIEIDYNGLKEVFRQSKEPGSYLVRTLEDKEKIIIKSKKEVYGIKKENCKLKSKLEFINEKYNDCLSKMNSMEIKKDEIYKIKEILMNLNERDVDNPYLENNLFRLNKLFSKEKPVMDLNNTLTKKKRVPQWCKNLKKKNA